MSAARRGSDAASPHGPSPDINIVNLSDSEFAVLTALREVGFGQVEVVVHDSRIVQITRSERVRVDRQSGWAL